MGPPSQPSNHTHTHHTHKLKTHRHIHVHKVKAVRPRIRPRRLQPRRLELLAGLSCSSGVRSLSVGDSGGGRRWASTNVKPNTNTPKNKTLRNAPSTTRRGSGGPRGGPPWPASTSPAPPGTPPTGVDLGGGILVGGGVSTFMFARKRWPYGTLPLDIYTPSHPTHPTIAGWLLTYRDRGQGPAAPAVAIAPARKERRGRPDPCVRERPGVLLERALPLLLLGLEANNEGAGRAGQAKEGNEEEEEPEGLGAGGSGAHGFGLTVCLIGLPVCFA